MWKIGKALPRNHIVYIKVWSFLTVSLFYIRISSSIAPFQIDQKRSSTSPIYDSEGCLDLNP